MGYTCTICTDYVDESKTEEILKNCKRIITEALRVSGDSEGERNEKDTECPV